MCDRFHALSVASNPDRPLDGAVLVVVGVGGVVGGGSGGGVGGVVGGVVGGGKVLAGVVVLVVAGVAALALADVPGCRMVG